MNTVFDYTVKDRKGNAVSLRSYANEVLLIVNTATKSPYTPQYTELEALYEKYHSQGFAVLDFPSNQPTKSCPGKDDMVHEFVKETYNTEFPRFKKVKVNGPDADPLYKFLTSQKGFAGWDENHPLTKVLDEMLSQADPDYKSKADIKWNFTKFLVNKYGMVVERFEPTENMENVEKKIEELL